MNCVRLTNLSLSLLNKRYSNVLNKQWRMSRITITNIYLSHDLTIKIYNKIDEVKFTFYREPIS